MFPRYVGPNPTVRNDPPARRGKTRGAEEGRRHVGNHDAGKAMGIAAEAALGARRRRKLRQQEARDILDAICESWRGCDAEFEAEDPKRPGHQHPEYIDYTDFNAPLGKIIAAAFTPGKTWTLPRGRVDRDASPVWEAWYTTAYAAFKERYEFY